MQFAEVTSVFGDAFLRGAGTVRFCERRNRTTMEGQTLLPAHSQALQVSKFSSFHSLSVLAFQMG